MRRSAGHVHSTSLCIGPSFGFRDQTVEVVDKSWRIDKRQNAVFVTEQSRLSDRHFEASQNFWDGCPALPYQRS